MKFVAYGETHPGYVRSNNEDAFLLLPEHRLAVVADGMAGHQYGEMASSIAVDTIRRFYSSEELDSLLKAQFARSKRAETEPKTTPYELFRLRRSVEEANLAINNAAKRNPQYETMGTTLVAVCQHDRSLHMAYVGDSRIYRLRAGKLEQLSQDHSLLNEYIRLKYVTPEEAATFPLKNVIIRAMGLQDWVTVDVATKTAKTGDVILLCSDGLSDYVGDDEIRACLEASETPESRVKGLIDCSLKAGGPDNVTALVVQFQGGD